jgi:hypothetical protein
VARSRRCRHPAALTVGEPCAGPAAALIIASFSRRI